MCAAGMAKMSIRDTCIKRFRINMDNCGRFRFLAPKTVECNIKFKHSDWLGVEKCLKCLRQGGKECILH